MQPKLGVSGSKLKEILKKKPGTRSKVEVDCLVQILQKMNIFKGLKILEPSDYKEIVSVLQFKKVDPGETLMEYGDELDNMYILLRGKASVVIRNEIIYDWDWMASIRNAL